MAEEKMMTNEEFEAAAKVFLKYQSEKDQLEKKFKALKNQMRLYMEGKELKSKAVAVDGDPYSVTWTQATQVVWEEDIVKGELEPKGLWDEVVVYKPVFDPNRIVSLIEDGRIEEKWAMDKLATIKKSAPYVKVVAAKGKS